MSLIGFDEQQIRHVCSVEGLSGFAVVVVIEGEGESELDDI